MSLYSNSLCGLVLLTDSRVQCVAGVEGELAGIAMRSTEFHFPTLEQQLEGVRAEVKRSSSWRTDYWAKKAAAEAALGGGDGLVAEVKRDFSALNTGDFYLTRHSNLCETHVVFHMVVDDTLDNINISSRHPVIMGLRNVLKTACLNDITSLTVPLLLGHHMTEKMTVPWCLRRWERELQSFNQHEGDNPYMMIIDPYVRAELVFKCLKGFMMEMGGWGGSEIKTLQFLLPASIDQDVFLKLTAMLSTIFRVSSAIRG